MLTTATAEQLDLALPDLPPRHTLTVLGAGQGDRLGLCPCGWQFPPSAAHPDVIAAAFRRHVERQA